MGVGDKDLLQGIKDFRHRHGFRKDKAAAGVMDIFFCRLPNHRQKTVVQQKGMGGQGLTICKI